MRRNSRYNDLSVRPRPPPSRGDIPLNPSPAKPSSIIAQVEGSGAAKGMKSMPCGELSPVSSGVSTIAGDRVHQCDLVEAANEPPLNAMIGVLGSSPVSLTS